MSNIPQEPDHDKLLEDYEKFVKFFDEEKIPMRPAVCFSRNIKYFTNADMFKAFKEHKDIIPELLKNVHYNTKLVTDDDIRDFIARILQNMVVLKLCWKDNDRSQYPTELGISKDQTNYDENAFYGWVIVADSRPNFFKMMTLMLIPVVIILLVWLSLSARIFFYYVFVSIVILCVGLIGLKIKFYFLFSVFNKDVIVLPNLFEEAPLTHLFRPAVAVYKLHPENGKNRKYFTIAVLAIFIALLLIKPEIIINFVKMIVNGIWEYIESGKRGLLPHENVVKIPKGGHYQDRDL